MSSTRYKVLLSNLPGMAAVVNSFESEQVQIAVFDRLINALEEKPEFADSPSRSKREATSSAAEQADTTEVAHELVEGDSIHSDLGGAL